jgi:hypothetical protein
MSYEKRYREWLQSLKPGDEVAVVEAGGSVYIEPVIEVNSKIVTINFTGNHDYYSSMTGFDEWNEWKIEPLTDQHRKQVLSDFLDDPGRHWEELPLATLQQIKALIDEVYP